MKRLLFTWLTADVKTSPNSAWSPNTPGSLSRLRLQIYVVSSYFGTWEGVTISPYNLTNVFDINEAE